MSTSNKAIPKINAKKRIPKKLASKPPQKPKPSNIKEEEKKINTRPNKEVKQIKNESDDTVVSINSTINEVFATSEVTQFFTNTLSKSIELTISFPLKQEIQLSKFIITIGDKKVISKVLPKEKAEEKYTDSIAQGNTGFISTFDDTGKNYSINVGNVLPKEKVKLVSIYYQMITSKDMSYEFTFLEQYPCFIYEGSMAKSKKINGKFNLNTKSKITRLISPYMDENVKKTTNFNITFNEDYTKANINFEKNIEIENVKKEENIKAPKKLLLNNMNKSALIPRRIHRPLVNNNNNNSFNNIAYPGVKNGFTPLNYFSFLFRTEKMNKPMLYYQYNPEKKETAYCLNYVYASKNIKNIPVTQIPDQDCSTSYYTKYQENAINDNPGLFIFLVDQSGSMRGNSMDLVKKALVLFMQSLPQKSYFQIIGFGTYFKKYNETPVEYNKDNVKSILEAIKGFQANMGGTNISAPLKDIFESKVYDGINLSKNIFLLTDGQVNNRELCINLISVNSNRFRIHAIGIGNDFDKILIERAGKLGNGSSSYVEFINNINEVVIDILNKSLRPYLINLNFGFPNKSLMKNPILILEPVNNFTYQDEVISFGFILTDKNKINFEQMQEPIQVEISAKDPLNEVKESIKLSLDDNITKLDNGDSLSKTIVGQCLKFNKDLLESQDKEIALSQKYQILSKNTALFGEIKRAESSQSTELIKVNINAEKKAIKNIVKSSMPSNKARGLGVIFLNRLAKAPPSANVQKTLALKKMAMVSHIPKPAKTKSRPLAKNVMNLIKKPSYEQKSDGTIGIVDEFNDILMAQDIIEGFWDEKKETKVLVSKLKDGYEKIMEFIKSKNISENVNRIVYSILAIYYIEKEKAKKIKEYKLIINKGKKYLLSKGINYDEDIKKLLFK